MAESVFTGLAQETTQQEIAGTLTGVVLVADASPALSPIAVIGADFSAGSNHLVAPSSGRVKVEITHAGSAGRVWIGVGQAAIIGVGPTYLDAGDTWFEYTDEPISIWIDGTVTAQRIVGMEWGA